MSEVLTSISTAVIQGQKDDIAKLIQEALDEGQSAGTSFTKV